MSISVYELVTDRIIAELEKGVIPWHKPWTGTRNGAYSRSTGRAYSLLNQMLLGKNGEYLNFKQALESGGSVRKGEKGSIVVFWKQYPITEQNDKGETVTTTIPLLRYYNVFHIDQCEGIEPKYTADDVKPFDPIAEAEAIMTEYSTRENLPINHIKGNKACYSPARDCITLPLQEQFPDHNEYYSTALHELIHSTGHANRLNRLTATAFFGNEEYSKEELVAEIGSASLMAHIGIETSKTFKNSAAYIQSWIRALKNDNKMIVSASSKAEKAINYIMGQA